MRRVTASKEKERSKLAENLYWKFRIRNHFLCRMLSFALVNTITIRAFEKLTLNNQKFTVKNEREGNMRRRSIEAYKQGKGESITNFTEKFYQITIQNNSNYYLFSS